jgi:hypothetical protein
MHIRNAVILTATLLAAAVPAHAHFFPNAAKSVKASLVQSYVPCTSPDTTDGKGLPACTGQLETDPSCVFGTKGSGSLQATIKKTDVKVKAVLKGLDAACEGQTLTPAFTVRTTSDTCPTDHCTAVDTEITAGTCTVTAGKCTVNTTIPSGYAAGAGSEMSFLACGIKHGSAVAFDCGIMVK